MHYNQYIAWDQEQMNRMADINRNQNIVLDINHGGGGRGITISQEISSGVSEYGELESLYF